MSIHWVTLIFGVVILLAFYWAYATFTEVPEEERAYLDRPPIGYRLTWPLIRVLMYYFGGLLGIGYRQRLLKRLRKAGVEYILSPDHFFFSKIAAILIAGLFGWLLGNTLELSPWVFITPLAAIGFFYPDIWLSETIRTREKQLFRALPFYLDVITLTVESGASFTVALSQASEHAPRSPLKYEFDRVLRDVRAGKPRAHSLRRMAERVDMPAIYSFVSSVVQAEKTGANLGPVLRAQSDQRRTERFTRAEKLAMEAPVKMLGPLILFIFPNTFAVLGFVIITKAILANVLPGALQGPLEWALYWPATNV
ncbi:type II secretion system F family protein [Allohahella sp. A8]|uniref:type II secretion system F family protein n=1 Tax=Allohahella sp. A8 TaxID=3141461 RepID=UPI003A80921C